MTQETPLKVVDGENPPAPEVLAEAIVEIAAAMKKVLSSRLKRDTLILLVHWASRVPQRDVRLVLDSLEQLEQKFCNPKPKAKA